MTVLEDCCSHNGNGVEGVLIGETQNLSKSQALNKKMDSKSKAESLDLVLQPWYNDSYPDYASVDIRLPPPPSFFFNSYCHQLRSRPYMNRNKCYRNDHYMNRQFHSSYNNV